MLPSRPDGSGSIDTFVFADRAVDLGDFVMDVFDAVHVPEARTFDTDGLLLHSEYRIGDALLVIADRKPGWPYTPAFVRVYVDDVDVDVERATRRNARVVTRPTEFFGDTLARIADPHGNLWWVYRHHPDAAWTDEPDSDGASTGIVAGDTADDWSGFTTPELEYVHATLVDAMSTLTDPRSAPAG